MPKILVIEDELSVRENLIDLLEANMYEVLSAENGIVGINIAFEQTPDLIICDVMMPEINGHEVLDVLRATKTTQMIPFIFLTALGDIQSIRKGFEFGADDYLTKPYENDILLEVIQTRLERKSIIETFFEKDELQDALSKILISVQMLGKLSVDERRHSIEIIGNVCYSEIKLMSKNSGLIQILSSEELSIFHQLNEVKPMGKENS
jgi:DNA-binding response OmpR family regulator